MPALAFDHPVLLLALPFALLPLVVSVLRRSPHPNIAAAVPDRPSRLLSIALPILGLLALACLILALAGLHRTDQVVFREGRGAHLMILIDRSSSMESTFANRRPDGAEESKANAARRLLTDFIERRAHDRVGVAMFSTAPLQAVPLTDRHEIVKSAIATMDFPGLAQTNVGRGLALAAGAFGSETAAASRAILLVSDGAGVISREVQAQLRDTIGRRPVNLYWLFLRTDGAKGIFDVPASGEHDTPQTRPERHLHLFLQTLGVPYRAFEADSPDAVREAIAEIDRLEARPLAYEEEVPRLDLERYAYLGAAIALALLVLAKSFETPFVERARTLPPLRRSGA
ncbi:VWA domain-containing protein [Fulvimarina endophytica]|uniref:VWA domain-containing protein n=1 Tax=Fulvimarina endophytica TaxID=2293836 RepID=A0A371X2S6_9HYPH|nr:VWA domain-containing protein [Fulvimarina endophytica]RFC63522.1 VWA domain-containing protein [Fulvimarina endophytica]